MTGEFSMLIDGDHLEGSAGLDVAQRAVLESSDVHG